MLATINVIHSYHNMCPINMFVYQRVDLFSLLLTKELTYFLYYLPKSWPIFSILTKELTYFLYYLPKSWPIFSITYQRVDLFSLLQI